MREFAIDNFYVPITSEDISIFENTYDVTLPSYLKKFFLEYNGASIKENYFDTDDTTYVIQTFLPLLKTLKRSSVEDFMPWIIDDEFLIGRNDLIPFTIDPGGMPCLVSIGGNDKGVVYFSAVGLDENPLRKLADSFDEFLNGLITEEELDQKQGASL